MHLASGAHEPQQARSLVSRRHLGMGGCAGMTGCCATGDCAHAACLRSAGRPCTCHHHSNTPVHPPHPWANPPPRPRAAGGQHRARRRLRARHLRLCAALRRRHPARLGRGEAAGRCPRPSLPAVCACAWGGVCIPAPASMPNASCAVGRGFHVPARRPHPWCRSSLRASPASTSSSPPRVSPAPQAWHATLRRAPACGRLQAAC